MVMYRNSGGKSMTILRESVHMQTMETETVWTESFLIVSSDVGMCGLRCVWVKCLLLPRWYFGATLIYRQTD